MHDWKTSLKRAVEVSPATPVLETAYENVVREVLAVLNQQQYFRAVHSAEELGNLSRISIYTYPRRIPEERSIMIPIAVSAAGYVSVPTPAGMGYLDDTTPEGLRAYLVKVFTSDSFRRTLNHYKARNDEPIHGWLYRFDQRHTDLLDQSLVFSAEEQDKIVDAAESGGGSLVTIQGELMEPFGNFKDYDPKLPYRVLNSGGYVVEVTHHQAGSLPRTLTVTGKVRPLDFGH
jgi:hypothetical protein